MLKHIILILLFCDEFSHRLDSGWTIHKSQVTEKGNRVQESDNSKRKENGKMHIKQTMVYQGM